MNETDRAPTYYRDIADRDQAGLVKLLLDAEAEREAANADEEGGNVIARAIESLANGVRARATDSAAERVGEAVGEVLGDHVAGSGGAFIGAALGAELAAFGVRRYQAARERKEDAQKNRLLQFGVANAAIMRLAFGPNVAPSIGAQQRFWWRVVLFMFAQPPPPPPPAAAQQQQAAPQAEAAAAATATAQAQQALMLGAWPVELSQWWRKPANTTSFGSALLRVVRDELALRQRPDELFQSLYDAVFDELAFAGRLDDAQLADVLAMTLLKQLAAIGGAAPRFGRRRSGGWRLARDFRHFDAELAWCDARLAYAAGPGVASRRRRRRRLGADAWWTVRPSDHGDAARRTGGTDAASVALLNVRRRPSAALGAAADVLRATYRDGVSAEPGAETEVVLLCKRRRAIERRDHRLRRDDAELRVLTLPAGGGALVAQPVGAREPGGAPWATFKLTRALWLQADRGFVRVAVHREGGWSALQQPAMLEADATGKASALAKAHEPTGIRFAAERDVSDGAKAGARERALFALRASEFCAWFELFANDGWTVDDASIAAGSLSRRLDLTDNGAKLCINAAPRGAADQVLFVAVPVACVASFVSSGVLTLSDIVYAHSNRPTPVEVRFSDEEYSDDADNDDDNNDNDDEE